MVIGISIFPWSASVVVLADTAKVTVLLVLLTEMDENPVGLVIVPIVKLVKACCYEQKRCYGIAANTKDINADG